MSSLIFQLTDSLKKKDQLCRIVFPEGNNAIIQSVAKKLTDEKLADCYLIFTKQNDIPKNLDSRIKTIAIDNYRDLKTLSQKFFVLRKGKTSANDCWSLIHQKNYFAIMLLKTEVVDCFLGGIEYATSDILLPAFQIIKTINPNKAASSVVLMSKNNFDMLFADCALTIEPNEYDLVNIAENTLFLSQKLGFSQKKVAMLSFSSCGSAKSKVSSLIKVQKATKLLKLKHLPNTHILGEVQFDAAFSPEIRLKKLTKDLQAFSGPANIFIFPDLNAANIGYKIAQRLGGYEAIGPIVLGLNKPVNDLSRGANFTDVYQTAIITLSQVLLK